MRPFAILAIHPPGEVEEQLLKDARQEGAIADAAALLVDLVNAPRRPGMHRRIDVAERPLIGGKLPVGMHVPLACHQHELLLGELAIHQRQRHAVERQVPCGVPGILPLVGHRNDVGVIEVGPLVVAPVDPLGRRRRRPGIALEPVADHIVIELLRPQHAGERLPHHVAGVRRQVGRNHGRVELVGFANPFGEDVVEAGAERLLGAARASQPQTHGLRFTRAERQDVPRRGLGAGVRRIDRPGGAVHDVVVDAVFDVSEKHLRTPKRRCRLVSFSVNRSSGRPSHCEPPPSELVMLQFNRAVQLAQDGALPALVSP